MSTISDTPPAPPAVPIVEPDPSPPTAPVEEKKRRGRPPKAPKVYENVGQAILADMAEGDDDDGGISMVYGDKVDSHFIDSAYYLKSGLRLADTIFGGGLGTGKISEVFGAESSGKSELAQLMAAEHLKANPEGIVVYFDQERSVDRSKLEDRPIFKSNRFGYFWAPTVEALFTRLEKMLIKVKESKTKVPSLIIVDSLAALLTEAEAEKEIYEKAVASLASIMTAVFKKVTPWLPTTHCHLMFLNQLRANFNGGGWGQEEAVNTPGGKAMKFYADYRIEVKNFGKYWVSDTQKKKDAGRPPDGQLCRLFTMKNKLVAPKREVVIPLLYNDIQGEKGLSDVWSVWELLKKRKVIVPKSQGNYYMTTEPVAKEEKTLFSLATWKETMQGPLSQYVTEELEVWRDWVMCRTTLSDAVDEEADGDEE